MDKYGRERSIGIRHEAIGICHDPFAFRVAPRRRVYGGSGYIDAMRTKTRHLSERAEVESVAAAGIENNIARRGRHEFRDRVQQRISHSAIM